MLVALGLLAAGCGRASPGWRLLVVSDRDGERAIYAVDPATGAASRLMAVPGFDDPIPSHDGRELIVPTDHPFVIGVDGANRQALGLARFDMVESWSPDGKRLVYYRQG